MAGDITLREYEDWVHPTDALERAKQRFGQRSAIRHLWDALGIGRLQAVAETSQAGSHSRPERLVFIPVTHWREVEQQGPESFFWLLADLSVSPSLAYSMTTFDYHGVRFNPRQLDKLLGDAKPATPASESPPRVVSPGRTKAWWREPVLIELMGQLYEGDLKPRKLKDLEDAATKWIESKGDTAGERTVRDCVRPLWERIQKEDKNQAG